MKRKLLYTLIFVLLSLGIFAWWNRPQPQPQIQPEVKVEPQPTIYLKQRTFNELPGWDNAKVKKSLLAFQVSCKTFIRQDPEEFVGSEYIDLKAKDWQPACHEALAIHPISEKSARKFFQQWFTPVEFNDKEPVRGLFTGYYMAFLHGSKTKTKEFNVPIYGLPSNLISINLELFDPSLKNRRFIGRVAGGQVVPYYTRAEINKGAIAKKAEVLVWVNSHVDRLFLEIQGSGTVELEDGSRIYVGYAGQNGAPYTAIAKVLIDKGVMTRDNASMQHIKSYLEAHPEEMDKVLNQNKSFVFFRELKEDAALGAQGVALTPGYSLAVDRKWIPLGAPLWLKTTRPGIKDPDDAQELQRLMIAQDTGGAIRGLVRGDVYWGSGDRATYIAGHMKNKGHYWLLLPRHRVTWLEKEFA
ncbi:Membrane-bound lytic murein transglycosylase A precursor [Legionella massiliensis]|uniref:Membrane-bound lytic murein transglycosylase A n=1 Tax=Legionella massiliensis TaxID=1034943 RepID=A0A078L1L4_9GAMM|nr:MltA domain-containing protein [Legionella massiliensis]CDZ79111.1 Membrane-bound lytic murein transglycosylase A precursor [Legionella massiliensis]CEE14849.1 Membrane-bound lytic murein transglycosylase A precursor [Legionella massiliensis]